EVTKELLNQWSIIIGEDSLHVTSTDCSYDNLMTCGKFAARMINLPSGITAKKIIPNIKMIGALTCYIPRSRNYRHRSEAIISFVNEEVLEVAIGKEWKAGEFNIKVTSLATKTCYRCHSEEHIAKDCPRSINEKRIENFLQDKLNLNSETNQYHSNYNEPEVDSQMDFDELNTHNIEESEEVKNKNEDNFGRLIQIVEQVSQHFKIATHNVRGFNDLVKRNLFFNYIKNEQFDIVGIAKTNCGESKGQWYKDNKDKFHIHCSGNGKGTEVALIISKILNKYVCKKREYEGRAFCVDLVLPRKMTICVMQIYLSIPSSVIDQNNNKNTGYIWKRDNSNEESRIDAIWMSHRWSDKITSCFLDDIKLITSSDHKLLGVKMLKKWQIREKDEEIYPNGPKYNMKLMDEKRWLKFAELVTVE
ncbi:10849_t:CDS:2, partial [Diversispora eburnea]